MSNALQQISDFSVICNKQLSLSRGDPQMHLLNILFSEVYWPLWKIDNHFLTSFYSDSLLNYIIADNKRSVHFKIDGINCRHFT